MIDVYNPFAKYNRPDDPWGGEDTGGSGVGNPPGEGEMLKNSAQDSAMVNEPETPYTNASDKLGEAREKITTLQEKLVEAGDRLLEADKECLTLRTILLLSKNNYLN